MRRKIKASKLPAFDPAAHIKDEKHVAAYVTVALEENVRRDRLEAEDRKTSAQ